DRWIPTPGLTWDYLLGGDKNIIGKSDKDVVTFDIDYAKDMVPILHNKGQKAVCYFSGGSSQSEKDDFKDYQKAGVVRKEKTGWGNYVIDIKNKKKLQPLIRKRIQRAVSSGCDAIEVDSLDVPYRRAKDYYTKEDSVVFAKWLAETAHEENISIGLKNLATSSVKLEPYFDFAVVESCAEDNNLCDYYKAFTKNDKAVFIVHYEDRGWKLSSNSKLKQLIKEQGSRKFTCVLSKVQDLNTHSVNYNCDNGAVIGQSGKLKKTTTSTSTEESGKDRCLRKLPKVEWRRSSDGWTTPIVNKSVIIKYCNQSNCQIAYDGSQGIKSRRGQWNSCKKEILKEFYDYYGVSFSVLNENYE
ncbi:glycoside hydrolase family 114 protein, partial [Piromyces sp. E2]